MVTTYEGLRDGLREGNPIGLVLHQNDSDGASHGAFYDLVQVGDLMEWREAADCWVRYHVDEVHADPAGDPPRKLLTIQVYSYAYTGCSSGTIDHDRHPNLHLDAGEHPDGQYHRPPSTMVPYVFAPNELDRGPAGAGAAHAHRDHLAAGSVAQSPTSVQSGREASVRVEPDDGNAVFALLYWHDVRVAVGRAHFYRLPIWPLGMPVSITNDPAGHFDDPTAEGTSSTSCVRRRRLRPAVISPMHRSTRRALGKTRASRFYDADSGVVYAFSGGNL